MHLNSGNINFTSSSEVNKVVNELSKSLCSEYQEKLERPMKGSDFIFDSVQLSNFKAVVHILILQLDKIEKNNNKSKK